MKNKLSCRFSTVIYLLNAVLVLIISILHLLERIYNSTNSNISTLTIISSFLISIFWALISFSTLKDKCGRLFIVGMIGTLIMSIVFFIMELGSGFSKKQTLATIMLISTLSSNPLLILLFFIKSKCTKLIKLYYIPAILSFIAIVTFILIQRPYLPDFMIAFFILTAIAYLDLGIFIKEN